MVYVISVRLFQYNLYYTYARTYNNIVVTNRQFAGRNIAFAGPDTTTRRSRDSLAAITDSEIIIRMIDRNGFERLWKWYPLHLLLTPSTQWNGMITIYTQGPVYASTVIVAKANKERSMRFVSVWIPCKYVRHCMEFR